MGEKRWLGIQGRGCVYMDRYLQWDGYVIDDLPMLSDSHLVGFGFEPVPRRLDWCHLDDSRMFKGSIKAIDAS